MNSQEASGVSIVAAAPAPRQTVLWIIAVLLAVIATALVLQPQSPWGLPKAYGDGSPMAGARGVFAFTGALDKNRFGLFMMDVDSSNLWCYEFVPTTRKLRLVAARSFKFDRYLEDFENADGTKPEEVRQMLAKQDQAKARVSGLTGPGSSTGTTAPGAGGSMDLKRPDAPLDREPLEPESPGGGRRP